MHVVSHGYEFVPSMRVSKGIPLRKITLETCLQVERVKIKTEFLSGWGRFYSKVSDPAGVPWQLKAGLTHNP